MLNLNPTVFVVDRDASVRATLALVISRAGWTPESFASAGEFLARPRLRVPSSLVLEIGTPDVTGFDLLARIAAERKETPVIAVAGQSDIPITVRAMRAGAVEFLTKPLVGEVLLTAIGHAIARSRDVLVQDADRLEFQSRYDSLSDRERQVLAHVVAGYLNKRIGAALGISEITVKAHRGKMMRKMGAQSLAELVMMAMRLELPSVPATLPPLPSSTRRYSLASLSARSSAHSVLAAAR